MVKLMDQSKEGWRCFQLMKLQDWSYFMGNFQINWLVVISVRLPEKKVKTRPKKQRRREPSVAELTKSLVSTDESDENPKMKYMYIGDSDEDSDSDSDCND